MLYAMRVMALVGMATVCFAGEEYAPSAQNPDAEQTALAAEDAARQAEQSVPKPAEQGFKYSGWAWITMGQFKSSPFNRDMYDANFEGEWISDFDAGFKIVAPMAFGWTSRFHLGMTTAYPVPYIQNLENSELMRRKLAFYMIDAAMEKKFMDGDKSYYWEFGFFPVKYNPQAMNLGEYLFRSGTYPQTLYSGFELADKEKLVGAHFQFKTPWTTEGFFKSDFFFTSGFRDAPIHDFSPAVILTASPSPVIEAGVGLNYEHLISVDERKTTPGTDPEYSRYMGTSAGGYYFYIDTAAPHDTITYTFRGLKAEARLTLNPQALLGIQSKFIGKEDFKLYGELAVLGVKNYTGWYEKMSERAPFMFGFNFPSYQPAAFTVIPAMLGGLLTNSSMNVKLGRAAAYGLGGAIIGVGLAIIDNLLNIDTKPDVLAMEGEYFTCKYLNSTENVWKHRSPAPNTGSLGANLPSYVDRDKGGTLGWTEHNEDDWKWSIYMSKKLFKSVRVSAQVASDHATRSQYLAAPPSNSKYTELVPASFNWYWMARAMYFF
jgi:hypothetical protein